MERPVSRPIGTPAEQLDTPALVVDLAIMERNIETLHSFFRTAGARARPHTTAHKCPAIAHKQMAAGGTAGGIAVSRVGEAEVFARAGFGDILVTGEVVTRTKISRLCTLAHHSRITVAVDNPKNVEDLSESAQAVGVSLDVVVDINAGLDRCGVEPGAPSLELAKHAGRSQDLRFVGVMAYEGNLLHEDDRDVAAETQRALQPVLDTVDLMKRAGLSVQMVSVGGTHNYQIAGATDGVTEVQVGSYPLMDHPYCQQLSQFAPAARVLTTVISHPTADAAVTDAGHKATGPDRGLPVVEGIPGARAVRFSAEHCRLDLEGEAQQKVDVGTKVWLVPWDLELCVNQYDYIHAVRDGKLEAVWEIAARGRLD